MMKMINVTKTKALLFSLIFACFLCIMIGEKFMEFLNIYDFSSNNTTLSIDIKENKNKHSYGNEMRIVSVTADDEKIDLSKYSTDNWIWHEEWGYILYQEGNPHFEIKFDRPLQSLQVEYVCQAGSGNADMSINSYKSIPLKMYSKIWKNKIISIKLISEAYKILFGIENIFLWTLLAYIVLKNTIFWKLQSEKDYTVINKIGMFDFAKGIGIIGVILGHTLENVNILGVFNNIALYIIEPLYGGLLYGVMAMFYVASGYNFKVADIKRTIRMQLKYLVKPYLVVALGTLIVQICRVFLEPRYSLGEFKATMLPFVLVNACDTNLHGHKLYSIGPMWFGVALCFAWIILNCIMSIKAKQIRVCLAFIIIIGCFITSQYVITIFCVPQILLGVIFLYVGYFIRSKKLFINESGIHRIMYSFMGLVVVLLSMINGLDFNIATEHFGKNFVVGILASLLGGVLLLRVLLYLTKNIGTRASCIKSIGRVSYLILYIHAFEWLCIPWGKIFMNTNPLLAFVVIFLVRSLLIYLLYKCVLFIRRMNIKKVIN